MSSTALLFVRTVIARDGRFLATTILSCIVAATVATFQYSVYNSFRLASAVVPRVVAADYWIHARSVASFDFPTPFAEDYAAAAAGYFPNGQTRRVAFGFVPWRSPKGQRGNVALVGIDDLGINPHGFVANRSDLERLDLAAAGVGSDTATVGEQTLVLEGVVDNLATYLGAPYILTDVATARRLLGMDPTSVAFLAGETGGQTGNNITRAEYEIEARFPDIALSNGRDFASSSADYWLNKTGAGLAIGLAALLASLLMVILFANGVLRFIQRYFADLISLLGHGTTQQGVGLIVVGIALVIAAVTLAGAIIITPLLVLLSQPLLPWVVFSTSDLAAPIAGTATALLMSLISARRSLAAFAPDAVFRT
jgi:hypothetical protein